MSSSRLQKKFKFGFERGVDSIAVSVLSNPNNNLMMRRAGLSNEELFGSLSPGKSGQMEFLLFKPIIQNAAKEGIRCCVSLLIA